mmetsp:Transcript_900/g.2363  ORF Transcript_900/g.2363 Transcript_900/m.2363 type:complete len:207 (+) Transcript_900:196-816(+)
MYRCFCFGAVLAWFLNTVSSSHFLFKLRSPVASSNGLPLKTSSRRARSSCFSRCALAAASSASRSCLIFASSRINSSVSSSSSSSSLPSLPEASDLSGTSSSASSGKGLSMASCGAFGFDLPSRSAAAFRSLASSSSRSSRREPRSSTRPWPACRVFSFVKLAASLFATFVVGATKQPPLGLEPLATAAFHVGRCALVMAPRPSAG